jgi:TolB protein
MTVLTRSRVVWPRFLLAALIAGAALVAFGARGVRPAPLPAPALSGRIAYAVAGNLWLWQGGAHRLTSSGHDGSPSLSADGQRVAYVRYDDSFSDIVIQPTSGGEPQFLTNNRPSAETGSPDYVQQALWALNPAWSPDGRRLAFVSDRGTDAPVLWLMGQGGDNPHSLTTTPPNPVLERPNWSPGGDSIVATSLGSGKDEIWSLNLDSGVWNEAAAPADGSYDPSWSPDGAHIAYAARTGRSTDIWLTPADRSSPPVQLTHLGRARAPVFSPDGKQIAFVAEKDERFQIFVMDLGAANGQPQAGAPQQLTDAAEGVDAAAGLSWSR